MLRAIPLIRHATHDTFPHEGGKGRPPINLADPNCYASHPAATSRQRASFVSVSGDPVFARASSSLR